MKKIVIWYKPKDNSYYYKIVRGCYCNYEVGYINRYGHVIILVIDIFKDIYYKPSLKKRVLTKIISFLQKYID